MRAISMTPNDAVALTDGIDRETFGWMTDMLPPSMEELIAIHSANDYPTDAAALARAERLTPTLEIPGVIVAVARAGHWQRTRYKITVALMCSCVPSRSTASTLACSLN